MMADRTESCFSTASINRAAEEWYGIKADPGDVEKLQLWLQETYGEYKPEILKSVFLSGEATAFLTVNETYFFREPAHFTFLWERLSSFEGNYLRICSAAVATGCEAYSIAMMIEAYNKCIKKPLSYHIDAFDINPLVIETANKGIYTSRCLREDGNCFHYLTSPYLMKTGGRYQVNSALKKNISFFVHNLIYELPSKEYDLIFFRNAFIYFTSHYRERVLSNLSAALKERGFLIMGVTETAGVNHNDLNAKNNNDVFYFQKV
jgi:chemotaxis protein methyltransferase CheR